MACAAMRAVKSIPTAGQSEQRPAPRAEPRKIENDHFDKPGSARLVPFLLPSTFCPDGFSGLKAMGLVCATRVLIPHRGASVTSTSSQAAHKKSPSFPRLDHPPTLTFARAKTTGEFRRNRGQRRD